MFLKIDYMIAGDDNAKFLELFIFKWNIFFIKVYGNFLNYGSH